MSPRTRWLAAAAVTAAALVLPQAASAHGTGLNGATRPGDRVLVKFAPGAGSATVSSAIDRAGATDVGTVRDLGIHVLKVPAGAASSVAAALGRRSDVTFAEAEGKYAATTTPNDTYWSQQWGPAKVNAPAAWTSTTGSSSVVVAVLDTGVYFGHADLQNRFVPGYDFINGDADPTDDNGHGTETAGIIGATGNNGAGIAGMCWTCSLMPVKVLDATAYGSWSAIANGITWATDHGAKVISMSLGGTTGSSTLQAAVQYAQSHDALVVAAAGNYSSSAPLYPASYAGVISVAGTQSDDTLYSFSDYGSWVSVAAPGCDYTTQRSGGYGSFCGTSAATPVVAGIAALARSFAPSATSAQVAAALTSSAVPIGSVVAYGRVDAAGTLAALGAPADSGAAPPPPPPPPPSTVTSTFSASLTSKAPSRTYSFTSGAGQLQLALTFAKSSTLTMTVRTSAGTTALTTTGASPSSGSAVVAAGSYSVTVSGSTRSSFTLTVTRPAS